MKYTIKYFGDEIRIVEGKCLNENNCICNKGEVSIKCYYSSLEIKNMIEKYYLSRFNYFYNMSKEDFDYYLDNNLHKKDKDA